VPSLAVTERLLWQAEVTPCPPANLDGDELAGWAWVDREDVDLTAPGTDIPADDRPADDLKRTRDMALGSVACLLGTSPRARRRAGCSRHDRDDRERRLSAARPGLAARLPRTYCATSSSA
jgi:hypothetical protein